MNIARNQKGIALFIALLVMIMLAILGIGIVGSSNDEISIAGNSMNESKAFYAADAGLEKAWACLKTHFDSTSILAGNAVATGSVEFDNATAAYVTTRDTVAAVRTVTQGIFAGLYGLSTRYRVSSMGTSLVDGRQVTLTQDFDRSLIPIYQFAIYDHDTLCIFLDSSALTAVGRVHGNGPVYLQCKQGLFFDGKFSGSGDIIHGSPNSASPYFTAGSQDIAFKDADGNWEEMYQDSKWLDATDSNWYSEAASRWDGNVSDNAFGVTDLKLPLSNPDGDAHKIIERAVDASGKANPDSYENQAGLKILASTGDANPRVYRKTPSGYEEITGSIPAGAIVYKKDAFCDHNEWKNVDVTDISIDSLKKYNLLPTNGIIYFSDKRHVLAADFQAARLTDAADLGQPLSVFCENPIYVKGDYNSVDKQPASIVADAVTFLSNNWNRTVNTDSLSGYANMAVRSAMETVVNAAVILGERDNSKVVTTAGGIATTSPSFQDTPRFLENWDVTSPSGVPCALKYTGSVIVLWKSRQALGPSQDNKGNFWRPWKLPQDFRWTFDESFKDPDQLPPGTPAFQIIQKVGWKMQNVGYAPADGE